MIWIAVKKTFELAAQQRADVWMEPTSSSVLHLGQSEYGLSMACPENAHQLKRLIFQNFLGGPSALASNPLPPQYPPRSYGIEWSVKKTRP